MTLQEMIDEFLIRYDLNGSGAVAGFEDDEIISFLNKAQRKITESIFIANGPEQLYSLNRQYENGLTSSGLQNTYEYKMTLPNKFLFYIDSSIKITKSNFPTISTDSWVRPNLIEASDAEKFVHSGVNNIILPKPVCYLNQNFGTSGEVFNVITDSLTTISSDEVNILFRYLKMPDDMTLTPSVINSELSEKWHDEIVEAAVIEALKTVNDARVRQPSSK